MIVLPTCCPSKTTEPVTSFSQTLSLATCQLIELLRASLRMQGDGAFCVIWPMLLPGLHKTTYQSCAVHGYTMPKILTLYL